MFYRWHNKSCSIKWPLISTHQPGPNVKITKTKEKTSFLSFCRKKILSLKTTFFYTFFLKINVILVENNIKNKKMLFFLKRRFGLLNITPSRVVVSLHMFSATEINKIRLSKLKIGYTSGVECNFRMQAQIC